MLPLTARPSASSTASLHTNPSSVRTFARLIVRVERVVEGDLALGERARLVGEQQRDVAEVFDAHESFHENLALREAREPVERLTVTIAGRSCGVRPIAIASENSSASRIGR